jgi:lipid-A-disaccharide synthase-like uncharacterized protein
MNLARKIYSDFINNKKQSLEYRLWYAQAVASSACKDKFMDNQDAVYVMEDGSRLVVTPDNLRVSLF